MVARLVVDEQGGRRAPVRARGVGGQKVDGTLELVAQRRVNLAEEGNLGAQAGMGERLGTDAGTLPTREGGAEPLAVARAHAVGAGHQLHATGVGRRARLDHIARKLVEGRAQARGAVGVVGVGRLAVVFR